MMPRLRYAYAIAFLSPPLRLLIIYFCRHDLPPLRFRLLFRFL